MAISTINSKIFNWLQISDLHYGLKDQEPLWPNLRSVFFEDLARLHDIAGPWNAVFFTGDLTQQGLADEFERLDSEVFVPLWEKLTQLGSGGAVLVPIPGNHDVFRPDSKKPSAALRQLLRANSFYEIEEEFWTEPACEYRQLIEKAFENYVNWLKKSPFSIYSQMQHGALPGDFSLTVVADKQSKSPMKIGIAGINTTFLQLSSGDYKGRLAWDIRQIHAACRNDLPRWVGEHTACILLTHHGPEWLDSKSKDIVYPEINPAGRFAVHMFGHMHESVQRAISQGGGPPLRQWQAPSLFGLEKFGNPPTVDRRHGYSVGQICFQDVGLAIRHWPRLALKDANGWRFERDTKNSILEERDGGTVPEQLVASVTAKGTTMGSSIRANTGLQYHPSMSFKAPPKSDSRSIWMWPHDELQMKGYCEAVAKAHSHIRFVEIPYLKDLSDVELDCLYVEPRLSNQEIHPDMALNRWPRSLQPLEILRQHPRLIVLGDPGSGKSTLISCISWQLCRPHPINPNAWAQEFGGYLPLPMILRELHLKSDLTWESLLDAFLEHRIGKLLHTRKAIESLLTEGRAVVLLDGLDEIGNLNVRKKLRDAVHNGMVIYPKSHWILTSRIVGYEQVRFDERIESISSKSGLTSDLVGETRRNKRIRTVMADSFFLAPFNDQQIRSFAINWYTQHEKDTPLIEVQAKEFVAAIQENEGTQRLGRIPYLLTLMALIHHKNARLPHGRTELYERIATAYLESIDLRRQLDQLPYSLAQKKRWLATVAYKMQLHRARKKSDSSQDDIVTGKIKIQQWLRQAMLDSGTKDSTRESEALLTYFAQRSGLLLPRGEGRFAFMHLSLQEYFAACFLEPRLTASRFLPAKQRKEPSNSQLRTWANSEIWTETFILLFELLSEKSVSEAELFLQHLFRNGLTTQKPERYTSAAQLLAELATNPFVFLTAETRRRIRQQCWRWIFATRGNGGFGSGGDKIIRSLLRETDGHLGKSWEASSIGSTELRQLKSLNLGMCSSLVDISALSNLRNMTELNISGCTALTDLRVIGDLPRIEALIAENCPNIRDFTILRKARNLKTLVVGRAFDFALLSRLDSLSDLHIHDFSKSPLESIDLSPISGLPNLRTLCLGPRSFPLEIIVKSKQIVAPAVQRLLARHGKKINSARLQSQIPTFRKRQTLIV